MKLKNIVNTIFFDVDHTLWDFEKNSALTFNKILDQYDFPFSNKEFLDIYIPINKKYWDDYSKSCGCLFFLHSCSPIGFFHK